MIQKSEIVFLIVNHSRNFLQSGIKLRKSGLNSSFRIENVSGMDGVELTKYDPIW